MIVYKLLIICSYMASPIDSQGIPPSHVKSLEKILSKYVNNRYINQGSMADFLFGDPAAQNVKSLNIYALDHNTLKNIIQLTTEKINNDSVGYTTVNNTRRQYFVNPDASKVESLFWNKNRIVTRKAFQLMRQSIYNTRERLQDLNELTNRFRNDPSYQIGFLVSTVQQLILKSETLYGMQTSLNRPHFLWPLIIYEKVLACHTDVSDLVHRAFYFHDQYKKTTDELLKTQFI